MLDWIRHVLSGIMANFASCCNEHGMIAPRD